jgi:hypothetical protein
MPSAFDRAMRRAARRQRNRRIGAALLALVVFAGAGTGLWLAFQPGAQRRAPQPAELPLPGTTSTIALPSTPTGVVVASDGTVWAALPDALARIDPVTDAVTTEYGDVFSAKQGELTGIAIQQLGDWQVAWISDSGGYVWSVPIHVPSKAHILPPPPRPVDVGGPALGVAFGDGSVWATVVRDGPGELVRLDPRTNEITGRFTTGDGPGSVAVGPGGVWVQVTSGSSGINVFDPVTGQFTRTVGIGGGGGLVASASGEVWASGNDKVGRLFPTEGNSPQVVSGSPQPPPSPAPQAQIPGAGGLSIASDQVWVAANPDPSRQGLLYEIDRTTGDVIGAPTPVGLTAMAVAVGDGSVWVANYNDPSITRVQLVCGGSPCVGGGGDSIPTATHVSTFPLSARATDIAVAPNGTVWVTLPNALARIDPHSGAVHEEYASVFAGSSGHLTGITIVAPRPRISIRT